MSGLRASSQIRRALEFREDVRRWMEHREGPSPWDQESLNGVRKVVLILSAPRSGSSLLHCILKTLPELYSLSGECVPFYKLNGLASDSDSSDSILASGRSALAKRRALSKDILSDCSLAEDATADIGWEERYIDDIALRLPLQWPQVSFSYRTVRRVAQRALEAHREARPRFCKKDFYLELLPRLRESYTAIDPYYYDIPTNLVAARFPDIKIPTGPPNGTVLIEEPPFILLEPRRRPNLGVLKSKALLLKSTVNSYRLDYILSLFPNADIRVIYLIRHPLASINGLCDGWLHRGFFSHNLRTFSEASRTSRKGLSIAGYSDTRPWTKWWWNFDLPPGWQGYTGRSLEEVCAFQWKSANRAVQTALQTRALPYLRIKFENLVSGVDSRKAVLRAVCRFLAVDFGAFRRPFLEAPPVIQATNPPNSERWLLRRATLLPLLGDRQLQEECSAMGYRENDICATGRATL
jgi:hypothetical protein